MVGDAARVAFVLFGGVGDGAGCAERRGVEGCLRDQAVREGDPEEAGYAGGEAKEEEVPVEAGGFSEREFGALGYKGRDLAGLDGEGNGDGEGLTIMIEVKEDGKENSERNGDEDVADGDVPEVDEPAAVGGWEERFTRRES